MGKRNKGLQFLWPALTNEQTARQAVLNGFYIIFFSVGVTVLNYTAKFSAGSVKIENLIGGLIGDLLPLALCGFFMYKKMSKAACIIAVIIIFVQMIFKVSMGNGFEMLPFFMLILIGSSRGAFAYHNMIKTTEKG